MAVRNIMSIGKSKPIPIYIWIPPKYSPIYKIEVEKAETGTTYDVTDIIHRGEYTDGVTDIIGNFEFTIDNSSEEYTSAFEGNDILNVYIDYDTSATTKRFRGRIEKVSNNENKITLIGRTDAIKLLGKNVTGYSTNVAASSILENVLNYFVGGEFTYNNLNVSETLINANWDKKPLFEVVQDICNQAGFDFYIDTDLDVHFFEKSSVNNTTEAVIHGQNIFSIDDFSQDYSQIKNRVVVQGKQFSTDNTTGKTTETPIIYTKESTGTMYGINSSYGVRELIIEDENINSYEEALSRATYELLNALNPPVQGEVECYGLATIQPGERIRISSPTNNLPPNYYPIISYTQKFEGMMTTRLNVNKENVKISKVIKDNLSKIGKISITKNPNAMEYTFLFNFNSDSGTHTNTQITSGVLKTDGSASGTWESGTLTINGLDVSHVELRLTGSALAGTKVYASTNGGDTYTQKWGSGASSSTAINPGNKIKLKVVFSSASTQIDNILLLFA